MSKNSIWGRMPKCVGLVFAYCAGLWAVLAKTLTFHGAVVKKSDQGFQLVPTNPPAPEGNSLVDQLSATRLFQDYRSAFEQATGLPLMLRARQAFASAAERAEERTTQFCSLIGRTNFSCAKCLRMQESLEETAQLGPDTIRCFAGLCESAVPIRVGDEIVAFLRTGHVLLHKPSHAEFTRTTRQLLKWGSQIDLKSLEEAYFQTKVFDESQYHAAVRLLTTFAEHLGRVGECMELQAAAEEPEIVQEAREIIRERSAEHLTLSEAARAVNTSTRYFCKVFKDATGMTFIEYLNRVRIEKAQHLLRNPNLRVSEIAFEVGFESLSQFNRSFKRITGQTPSTFRTTQAAA